MKYRYSLKHWYFPACLMVWLMLVVVRVQAQEITKVMGLVRDAATGDTLPFVSVYFQHTQIGATTGFDGKFSVESRKATDTLIASYIGYKTAKRPVQLNHFQVINIDLQPEKYDLPLVVVVPGENPAEVLLRKIVDHKAENDPDKVAAYRCQAYTKMQFDINNLTEKLRNRKVMEPFKFVFEHMDTSTVNGKVYLPVMMSETFSDIYFRHSPRVRKEIIKASQISGVENSSMSQFVGNMAQDVNFYDNYINLFQKNFPSPISALGLMYYKYYLVDSTNLDGHWSYNVMFKPRRKQENAFTGNFWVADTSFAIKKYEMRMVPDANINFINDLVISQEFEPVEGKQWMVTRERMIADFNIVEDAKITAGFFGTRTVLFSKYNFSPVADEKIYNIPNNIVVLDDANRKPAEFWEKSRPEALSHREASVYHMADTLKKMPIFNTYLDIVKIIGTGYYIKGPFEFGPYGDVYSFNGIEGSRFRLGGRTSNDFSTRLMLEGFGAYGTLDRRFKYTLGFTYMLGKLPDRVLKVTYKYDTEQLGMGDNSFREDFIFNSLFRRNPQDKLSMVKEFKGSYKHEWFTGLSNTITLDQRSIYNIGMSGIRLYDPVALDYVQRSHISTTEIRLDMHYGVREKVLAGEFERKVVSSPYPVFDLQYAFGVKGLFDSEYNYHKVQLRTSQWFSFMSAGWLKYTVEAGKVWGTLPFPLLRIYPGNETFYRDEYAFNLMNYYEFISDEYATYQVTHHFSGFFLNRIPAIRKLKWREVVQVKGAFGHTSQANKTFNELPAGSYFISIPYMEAGAGIENIFRFIRVDAVWRMFHNDHPNTSRFGVLVSASLDF